VVSRIFMSDAPSLQPGTLLADKFRIERLLGAGAMGEVYAIRHELTRHRRALKLLHASVRMVPDIVRRFLDEASAAGRAGNAHLVETFDAGILPSGEPYVVMELLDGETLSAVLERQGPLAVADAAEWVAQAAEGIDAAHRSGIIHRDLKPDNLFLTQREGRPFVKILDFGVSKFATESGSMSQTRAGMMYGSPAYMSPEQLTGSVDIDPRTDVFALGVVLFQGLTGKLPFDGPTLEALAVRILAGVPTPIESLRPDLPPPLVAVVARALAPQPALRFPSAQALADALGPFRAHATQRPEVGFQDTAHAPRPVFGQSLSPPPTRSMSPLLFGTLALLLVAVVAGALFQRSARGSGTAASAAPGSERTIAAVARVSPAAVVVPLVATSPSAFESTPAQPSAGRVHVGVAHPRDVPVAVVAPAPQTAVAPPASASAHSSAADSLGLHQSNPFR
jgi:eukaryotic-like serine/threonine-protein kinase